MQQGCGFFIKLKGGDDVQQMQQLKFKFIEGGPKLSKHDILKGGPEG